MCEEDCEQVRFDAKIQSTCPNWLICPGSPEVTEPSIMWPGQVNTLLRATIKGAKAFLIYAHILDSSRATGEHGGK